MRTVFALGIAGLLLAIPSRLPREVSPPNEIERGPVGMHRVALTFDAGGEADAFPFLLAALDRAKIRCTFFLTGRWAAEHPDLAAEIHRHGHEIGNHSWSHPDFTRLSDARIREEVLRAEQQIATVTGRSCRPLFRAPYGARDPRVLRLLHELGYFSIYWTLDSLDSISPPKTPEFLIARVTQRADAALDGAIILMHVGEPGTAAAVPAIVANLQQRGFRPGTISDLLRPK